MNRLALVVVVFILPACSSPLNQEDADSLSSAAVARTDRCDSPLLAEKSVDRDDGFKYVWNCRRESDGSQRELDVTVSRSGDVEILSMTTAPDDPVFELRLKGDRPSVPNASADKQGEGNAAVER